MVEQQRVLAGLLAIVSGCASGNGTVEPSRVAQSAGRHPVTVRVIEDSVRLFRSPKGASMRVTVRVHNRSDIILYVDPQCGSPALQRQVGAGWQTVWDNQNCSLEQLAPVRLAPGDSTTVFAHFWGSTGTSAELAGWPAMDPRVEPGVYRLVPVVGPTLDRSRRKIEKRFPDDQAASEAFVVHEVRRP
jgi:hypothetical protein